MITNHLFVGILIMLEGESEDIVKFAPNVTATSITVSSYTVSPILEFKLKRLPDGKLPDTTFVEFVSSSPYSIATKHKIVLTWLGDSSSGQYEIYVQNARSVVKKKTFHLLKAKRQFLFCCCCCNDSAVSIFTSKEILS